jgi:hemolysin III
MTPVPDLRAAIDIEVDPTERFSFLSHAVGALAAAVGLVLLLMRAAGPLATACVAVYGASLIALLVNSSLHHAIHPASEAGQRRLRLLDHISIFVLIAGTYTPAALVGLGGAAGWALFALVWGFALAGIAVKVGWRAAPRWVSTAIYVGVGWTVLAVLGPFVARFAGAAIWLVFGAGAFYTVGAAIYALKRPDPWPRWLGFHGLWHVFVLIAAGMHYAFVYAYVLG